MKKRDSSQRYEAGVWAVPLALFPAFLLSAAFGQPSCIEPVIELIISYTPVALADVILQLTGPLARPLALVGAIALLMPLGGLLGMVAPPIGEPKPALRQHLRWLSVILAALGAGVWLGSVAATPLSAVAAILFGVLFVPMLLWTRTWRRQKAQPVAGRRKVLRLLLGTPLVTVGIAALSTYELWSTTAIHLFALGNPIRRIFPFTAPGPRQSGFPVNGVEAEVTPVSLFYINGKDTTDPLILAEDWTLRVTGLVSNPLTISYAQLLRLPRTDLYATMRCVDNPVDGHLMSTALWSGVRVSDVLSLVQPKVAANTIIFHASDQFDEPFRMSDIAPDAALLAYAMNGETLTQSHGAPVRVLLPGWFGFRNIKWVQGMELTNAPMGGYWEHTGWQAEKIHPVARIDVAQVLDATNVLVAGVAFGGLQGISAVQVRVDNGPWLKAAMNIPPLSAYTWVQWRLELPVTAVQFRLTARMIDASGVPQDAQAQPVYPGGSSGLHTVEIKRT